MNLPQYETYGEMGEGTRLVYSLMHKRNCEVL